MMPASVIQPAMRVSRLLEGVIELDSRQDRDVSGIAVDSRQVRKGDLFMAVKGAKVNGLDYIDDAISRGAVCVLWECNGNAQGLPLERVNVEGMAVPLIGIPALAQQLGNIASCFYGHPSRHINVIGVTGTNGKTSVTHYLAQALSQDSACAVIGTLGYGLCGQTKTGINTTPGALTIQQLMHDFLQRGAHHVVMEVSSHGLDQGRLHGTSIDIAVFTNLTHDHLDYHGDMEAYGRAKRLLFEYSSVRHAVINVDDEFGQRLYETVAASVNRIGYSLRPDNDRAQIVCRDLRLDGQGAHFELVTPWGKAQINSPVLGRFNIANLLATVAALHCAGMNFDAIVRALAVVQAVPGRMERWSRPGSPVVVVDYAHTPDAMEQLLKALRQHLTGRLVCVFGCGGDRDRAKRPVMGGVAERLADVVVLTDDNPRNESPQSIVEDILAGMKAPEQVTVIHDREQAIRYALAQASEGDIVAVAGKGHEEYQLIGGSMNDFSDRKLVARLLSGQQKA